MKKFFYVSLSFLFIGCEALYRHYEPPYEPVYDTVFVKSEEMLRADYKIPDVYKNPPDDTANHWIKVTYKGKDATELTGISFNSNEFQIIPAPFDTVSLERYYRRNVLPHSYIIGMKVYLVNTTQDTIYSESIQDGSLIMVQQAKDEEGKWRSIECWFRSTCGNSFYAQLKLSPNKYINVNAFRYTGDFETELRFVLQWRGKSQRLYSRPFKGSINKEQFQFEGKKMFYVDFLDN